MNVEWFGPSFIIDESDSLWRVSAPCAPHVPSSTRAHRLRWRRVFESLLNDRPDRYNLSISTGGVHFEKEMSIEVLIVAKLTNQVLDQYYWLVTFNVAPLCILTGACRLLPCQCQPEVKRWDTGCLDDNCLNVQLWNSMRSNLAIDQGELLRGLWVE